MQDKTLNATFGGLLHDIGKVIHRAGTIDGRNHSISGHDMMKTLINSTDILDSISFHHKSDLKNANINADSVAYAVYLADNIAAASDRRKKDEKEELNKQFDKYMPLSSVFNLLNGNKLNYSYQMKALDRSFNYHENSGTVRILESQYNQILQDIKNNLKGIEVDEKYVNSLLTILETYLTFIPSSTVTNEEADISLYDHCKITSCVAACICEYLTENNVSNYKAELFDSEKEFMEKKAFLMFSCDFSGIQKFIYNIVAENALKSLRSRSFILEMLMEHLIDEILSNCGVSRANLIYSGGGHCYILLSNTNKVKQYLSKFDILINKWLIKNFGTSLYLASTYYECSANDLMNEPAEREPYKKIYQQLSTQLSAKKLCRYSAEEIRDLNRFVCNNEGRECKICGTVSNLKNEDKCVWCNNYIKLSSIIVREDLIILVSKGRIAEMDGITVPTVDGEVYLYFTNEGKAREQLNINEEIIRVYSKNKPCTGLFYSTKIYVGDYVCNSVLDKLANDSKGIERMAIYRADVDNLGLAFTCGFEKKCDDIKEKNKFVTLSRTATFSRQMSLFFKYYINEILTGGDSQEQFHIDSENTFNKKRNVIIVYSGGDDIFLAGAWNDVLEAAVDIQKAFKKYTSGTLTLSAGIGVYKSKYPIYKAAYESAELEEASKQIDGKNGITLFTTSIKSANEQYSEFMAENHTYKWDELTECVIGEKFKELKLFFEYRDIEQVRGNAFLYRLLSLLRQSYKKINVARYAYLLARFEPSGSDKHYKEIYNRFAKNMFRWILSESDRRELITAIYTYIYFTRKRRDE